MRHFNRKVGKTVGKILRVLLHQQRGRRQHRHLFATHYRHKRSAQRHFGFAKAHIATNQPVHRLARKQVFDGGDDGTGLVFGFFIAKAIGKLLIILLIQTEGMAFERRTLGIQIEQFGGGIARFFGGFALGLAP